MYCITVQHKVTVKQNVQYCSIHVCAYLYTITGTCFVNRNSKVKNTDVTLRRRTCADAQRCRVYSTSQGSKRGLYRGLYTVRGRTVHGLALSVPKSSTIELLGLFFVLASTPKTLDCHGFDFAGFAQKHSGDPRT